MLGGANGPLQGALRAWPKVNSHLHQNFHSLPEQRAHPTHPLKPPNRGDARVWFYRTVEEAREQWLCRGAVRGGVGQDAGPER